MTWELECNWEQLSFANPPYWEHGLIEETQSKSIEAFLKLHGLMPASWKVSEEKDFIKVQAKDIHLEINNRQITSIQIQSASPLKGIDPLAPIENLRRLTLAFHGGKLASDLSKLRFPYLEVFRVSKDIEIQDLEFIKHSIVLQSLTLHGSVGDFDFNPFVNLTALELSNANITIDDRTPRNLHLMKLFKSDLKIRTERPFPKLNTLLLSKVDFDEKLDVFKLFPNVESLIISYQNQPFDPPKGTDKLSKLKQLVYVPISRDAGLLREKVSAEHVFIQ